MAQPLTYSEGRDLTGSAADSAGLPENSEPGRSFPRLRRAPWIAISSALVAFIVVNLVVQRLQPSLMRLASYDFQYSAVRVADYYYNPRPDIIFLGSSRALEGFVPQVVDHEIARSTGSTVRSLNLSITGSSVELNYLLLKNIIEDRKKPKVIVYGFSEFEFDPDFAPLREANLPYYTLYLRPDDFARYAGPGFGDKLSFLLTTLCPVCRDATLIRNALSIVWNPDDPSHRYFAPGPAHHDPLPGGRSLWLAPGRGPKSLFKENLAEYGGRLGHYHTSTRRIALLNSLLALGRKRGIHMVLVNMPVTAQLRKLWRNPAAIQRYDTLVRSVAARNHATLLDLYRTSAQTFPERDFLDMHHLNLSGAEVLSRMVAHQDLAPLFRRRARAVR